MTDFDLSTSLTETVDLLLPSLLKQTAILQEEAGRRRMVSGFQRESSKAQPKTDSGIQR
jgi:hypothetical protein